MTAICSIPNFVASVSATANIAVTRWRNDQTSCGEVKQILAEAAYLFLIPCGALEAVARAICALVLGLVALCTHFLGAFLPTVMVRCPRLCAMLMGAGALISAGTVVDAAFSLIYNPCNEDQLTLEYTRKIDLTKRFPHIHLMTDPNN
jgi:hypothetical protein